jgi:hypothetical protein
VLLMAARRAIGDILIGFLGAISKHHILSLTLSIPSIINRFTREYSAPRIEHTRASFGQQAIVGNRSPVGAVRP